MIAEDTFQLTRRRVVPVVVADGLDSAVPLALALVEGGLPIAEVTLRTPDALRVIAAIARVDGFTVGAGTVVRPDQVDDAVEAGASFIVSPGVSTAVVTRCLELGIPVLPGVATATEVMQALDLGLRVLKFFPAETSGGAPAVAALGGPFPEVTFLPTGGVNAANAKAYLSLGNVAAIGGSWFVTRALQQAGDYSQVAALTREALMLACHDERTAS